MREEEKYIAVSKLYDAIERILYEEEEEKKERKREEAEEEKPKEDITDKLNAVMRHLRSAKRLLEELAGEREMEGYEFYGFITDIVEDLDGIIDEVSYIMESYVESR